MRGLNLGITLIMTMMLGYIWGVKATEAGLHGFIVGLVGIVIGFTVPMTIMKWLYGEENKQSETEEDSDISKN